MSQVRIGTRRSALATIQAELVALDLRGRGIDTEIVPMTTSGDEGATDGPQGRKGLWIDTILDALDEGAIDLAVHSAKDLPAEDDAAFTIAAVPPRADPFDLLITREETLPSGAVIGTSSLRRRAQLLAAFPGLELADLRGNVDTRLRKLADGEVDAAVMAAAGLARLGIQPTFSRTLPVSQMVPAPGQGCLAVQCRAEDGATLELLAPLDDRASHRALNAERSVMWRLGGGCALPLGAFAEPRDERLHLMAVVATPEGDRVLHADADGTDPDEVAGEVAKDLIRQGAEAILADVAEP